jgi:hypothetical protein
MTIFSNNKSTATTKAGFKKYHVHEVATSQTDAKQIADSYKKSHRYQHRAQVSVVGHPSIKPYDPIYLDGLPNGLSGYWTVLSVVHVFGGRPSDYFLNLEVGTDILGDTDPTAATRAATRDIQSELSGQSLVGYATTLSEFSLSPNASELIQTKTLMPTAYTSTSVTAVPSVYGATKFLDYYPNLGSIKNPVKWVATSNGRIVK